MSRAEIAAIVSALGNLVQVVRSADPAEIYGQLGLTLAYGPQDKRVRAEARPNSIM